MKTGFKKMFRDLMLYKGRTMLTLIGILIGVAAVGAVLSSYSILDREMNRNFMDTNPASIVLNIENLDVKGTQLLKQSYGDVDIELRKTIQARISRGDGTYGTIILRAVQDFENQKVDTFTLEKGCFPAGASEMVIERDSLKILNNINEGVGEVVLIKLPGGLEKDMRLSGRVHAPGLAPASMENYSYAFLSLEGLKSLGYKGWYDEIHIVSRDNRFDRVKMQMLSADIEKMFTENGYFVSKVEVPVPGKHPHADQLDSLLFLLQAFALISLLAACLIIINLVSFIMSRQMKQIAIMKTAGASTFDIAVPYLFYVFIISAAALIISFPLSLAIGNGYSNFAADILNFKISSSYVPYWVFLLQAVAGILIPLASAVYPIYKSCTKSVKEGLSERVGSTFSAQNRGGYFKKIFSFTNSKIIIPINNLLRKKTRAILAVLALLTGGVLFMTSQNIIASIDKTVDASAKDFRWDYNITLACNYPDERLKEVLGKIDGLEKYEIWKGNSMLLMENCSTNSVNCPVRIIPDNSNMVNLPVMDKLDNTDGGDAVIVNNGLVKDEKWIRPGMTLKVKINGKTADVLISGIVNEAPALPTVYMKINTYEKLFGGKSGQMVLASANTRDVNEQRKITRDIEAKFKSAGIELAENWNIYVLRKAFADHLLLIMTFLAAISMLAIIVGGLSIGSAIGINIAERKREMGVLRAVGVKRYQSVSMVLTEVLIMGILSWVIGIILSYPVSKWVGNYFGEIFLGTGLQNSLSLSGAVLWLIISVTVSMVAGLLPAWKTASSPLREMLEYE